MTRRPKVDGVKNKYELADDVRQVQPHVVRFSLGYENQLVDNQGRAASKYSVGFLQKARRKWLQGRAERREFVLLLTNNRGLMNSRADRWQHADS